MDGNRRFAREQGLTAFDGHRRGYEKLKEFLDWAKDAGVQHAVIYGFSTENWNRSPEEVSYLMKLLREVMTTEIEEIKKRGGRIRFVGQRERFEKDIQEAMVNVERETKEGSITLWLALSYGGRAEILQAVKGLMKKGVAPESVTDELFSQELWTAGMPDPDLIIRTGGVKRLSNFLPWQSVYSELFFVDTYWPAFEKSQFEAILKEYGERERRFGA